MEDISPPSVDGTSSAIISISTKIMISTVIVIFFLIALLVFLHLYVKWHWSTHEDPTVVSWRRRTARQRRQPAAAAATQTRGLDASLLRSLPVVVYNPEDFEEGLECAVCLSEVSQGEKARILPKCSHGFHVDCIDMWFKSHSTCPLCRAPVVSLSNDDSPNGEIDLEAQGEVGISIGSSDHDDHDDHGDGNAHPSRLPTNVLFFGDETQVSSLGPSSSRDDGGGDVGRLRGQNLVIEIPRELCEDCSGSPPEEGKSPVMTRLRSLKRLLSRGKRVIPSPSSASSSANVEQQV